MNSGMQQQQQSLLIEAEELTKEVANSRKVLIAVKEDITEAEFKNCIAPKDEEGT